MIKGGSRGSAGNLAAHLLRTDTNERVELVELTGVAATNLPAALSEMAAVALGTRCRKPLYHASINTAPGETLTPEQRDRAIAVLEKRLGLTGHARAVVAHRKEGRDHLHIVWSRIELATMRAVHDGHNYRAHEDVARQLEREFAHRPVQGAHVGRTAADGSRKPRPARTPPTADIQQAARTKLDPITITAEITRLWQAADSGPAFVAALQAAGYILAQGDKRGYCLIDPAGGVHSLARRIEGVTTKAVNARLADVPLASLPSVAVARDQVRQRQATPANPIEKPARPGAPPQLAKGRAGISSAEMPSSKPNSGGGAKRGGGIGSETLNYVVIRLASRSRGAAAPSANRATRQGVPNPGRLEQPALGGDRASSRPIGALLRGLGRAGGGGRRGTGPPIRVAAAGMLTLFLEPRPQFMLGGGSAASRVTPVKASPPERLNLRRPDGPSTESIAKLQHAIERLTAYGLATGESTAEQVQELKNMLHAMLEQLGTRAILGPYYRPEHRKQEPGR